MLSCQKRHKIHIIAQFNSYELALFFWILLALLKLFFG